MRRFDLAGMSARDAYQILNRSISPRPIAFVSSLSAGGQGNLAPFSYFNGGGANPPSVVFCVMNDRHGNEKDTLRNVRETGEYCISVVSRSMAERMNITSTAFPRGVNEFLEAGFTPIPSERIAPPRVGEAPISLECRLHEVLTHGAGALAGNYVVGEVLLVHVAEDVLGSQGLPDPTKVDFIGRMGGDWYTHAAPPSLFEMARPVDPPRERG